MPISTSPTVVLLCSVTRSSATSLDATATSRQRELRWRLYRVKTRAQQFAWEPVHMYVVCIANMRWYLSIYLYIYISIYLYIYISIYLYIYISIYLYIYISIYLYIYISIYLYIYISIYLYIYIILYIYISIYLYIYISIYPYIHIYIYICICMLQNHQYLYPAISCNFVTPHLRQWLLSSTGRCAVTVGTLGQEFLVSIRHSRR